MPLQVKDTTGRFGTRPHFEPEELDSECETIIRSFLLEYKKSIQYPINTDDLTKLIEKDASDLDLYADLSGLGTDVEGVTEFNPGGKPTVRISHLLSDDTRRENRFRTTLTHEYGHVRFHTYLWDLKVNQQGLFDGPSQKSGPMACKRENILQARQSDWMEWQAGYICGALLMPKTPLKQFVDEFYTEHKIFSPIQKDSPYALSLIDAVSIKFQVSNEAAQVRLSKLNFLKSGSNRSLWG